MIANEWLRVMLVDEHNYPGYVRVVWNEHVREMTELDDDAAPAPDENGVRRRIGAA